MSQKVGLEYLLIIFYLSTYMQVSNSQNSVLSEIHGLEGSGTVTTGSDSEY